MSDGGTQTPLQPPAMDCVNRRAKLEVGIGVARAYGLRINPAPDVCSDCHGDGCHTCWWTGEPAK